MTKTTTKRVAITEEQLAEAMPLGEPMDTRQVKHALGMANCETRPVATALTKHAKRGFVVMTVRSNRANLWTRTRSPFKKPEPAIKQKPELEAVLVRGHRVSLPKMPRLSTDV